MTTIPVNGTSIQAAIDGAQPNDTLDVKAGGYAGFTVNKAGVKVVAAGSPPAIVGPNSTIKVSAAGVTLAGLDVSGSTVKDNALVFQSAPDLTLLDTILHDGAMWAVRQYHTSGLKMTGGSIRKVAGGIEFNRGGQGSWVRGVAISDTDKMFVNDATPGNDTGGNGIVFYHSVGPIEVSGCSITRARSIGYGGNPASYDYAADGSAIEMFGAGVGPILIENNDITDCLHVCETGKNSGDADFAGVTWRGNRINGRTPLQVDDSKLACNGFLLRSAKDWTFEGNEFRNIDWWIFAASAGGGYGGALSNIIIRNNTAWLKPGVNRWFSTVGGAPTTPFAMSGNKVYQVGSTVAELNGTRYTDVAAFKAATGLEAGSTWGAEVIVPAETPLQVAIRERDAALASLALTQAALVSATTTIAVTTAERNAALAGRDVAEAGRLASVADAARVRAAADVAAAV